MARRDGTSTRTEKILRHLQSERSVAVEELCSLLNVSIATVRRDLQDLENRGLLRRTHGGAMMVEPLLYEGFRHDSSFREQMEKCAEEKRRIALAAADLIEDGETISLTPGTTTTEIVRSIRHRSGITVVTNTVNVAMELSQREDLDVVVSGGSLRGRWFSLVGPVAVQALEQIFTDKVFIGANGVDAAAGLTCHHADEAGVNRVMVQHAKQKIAVADASKLGVRATHRICGIDAIDLLITDSSATDRQIATFLQAGVKVRRV